MSETRRKKKVVQLFTESSFFLEIFFFLACYDATCCRNDSCLLTIVSTMFGFELRNVLAAKNTSATLWWRIISKIMVQAQKVPLRPPPFLLQEEPTETHAHTNTHTLQKRKDTSDLIKMCSQTASRRGELQSEMSQFDWAQIKHAVRKRPNGRLSRWISE